MATAVVDELRPLAAQKSIVLEVDARTPAWVLGQDDALRILLTNLIDNAIRYTAPSGRVHVSVQPGDATVQLIVQDTGPGYSSR